MEMTGVGRWRALPMSGGHRKFEARENRWIWHLPKKYATHLSEVSGWVTEDGRRLFRAPSHKEVRQHGAGRFRLHGRTLSFAAWDNSNPNTNGRTYLYHAPRPLDPWTLWGGLALVIAVHGLARSIGPADTATAEAEPRRHVTHLRPWLWAGSVFAVALAVRAALLLADAEHSDGYMMVRGMPYSDAAWWLDMAESMARGHGLSGPSDGQRPLYPIFLTPLLAAGLAPVTAAQWLNVVLGAATATILGGLVARLAGRWAGLAVAAFAALGGMQLKLMPLPMSETTGLALLVTGLAFLGTAKTTRWRRDLFLGGVFIGLSNLACPFTLLAVPALGVVAAFPLRPWRMFLTRGLCVAAGASLIIGPWLVRQKLAHGMATVSLNGPQMLYATVSPSGHYDVNIAQPLAGAGTKLGAAGQAQVYSRLFADAVRNDPGLYARRLAGGLTAWWEKFDPSHPSLLTTLIAFGIGSGLIHWWHAGRHGALLATALAPAAVLLASHLSGAAWAGLSLAGAAATRDRNHWRFAALAASVVAGCAAMNAMTSGALANRLWVMADVLIVSLAVLGLHHGITALACWHWPAKRFNVTIFPPASLINNTFTTNTFIPTSSSPPGLHTVAYLQGGWGLLAATLTAGLALRGPITSPIPAAATEAVDLARRHTLVRTGLADQLPTNSPLLWAQPVQLGRARARLPDRSATGHWSRAFIPRNHTRTVIASRTANGDAVTLQIPGDARHLPHGPFLAVGVLNHDPNAFFGAEIDMIEVLALWPLDTLGSPAATPIVFPVRSTVRSLVPKPPKPKHDDPSKPPPRPPEN